jgi:hypothetical protein
MQWIMAIRAPLRGNESKVSHSLAAYQQPGGLRVPAL